VLTAKIGNNDINCYDGKYSKKELKTWANKNIIKCPVCGKSYEYCHGQIISPYFRHKDKAECDYLYSEPETEEHIKGKIALYEWIKQQDGITNAILEAWLPETKQRPDIMFEYGGDKWVIEFQCSPIATEQIERHRLYEAAGIKDFWICGIDNYGTGRKYMEKIMYGMFDYRNNQFVSIDNIMRFDLLPHGNLYQKTYTNISLTDLTFKDKIVLSDSAMTSYIEKDIELQKQKEFDNKLKERIHSLYNVCQAIPDWYKQVIHNCHIVVSEGNISSPYLIMMSFCSDITHPFTMFVKDGVVDICVTEEYKRKTIIRSSYRKNRTRWETATKFVKCDELTYDDEESLIRVVKSYFSSKLREGVARKYQGGRKING